MRWDIVLFLKMLTIVEDLSLKLHKKNFGLDKDTENWGHLRNLN